ncbi:GlsB/YeaQ/YmgE family stress response membrane protein [Novilysobacter erysipheiresistens]|uniref:GlsB/YeaQ/YmgE family stress response membrane protein n=1 Tax=Novilysobacter erysipheiresistens TaxID=1749332 RepID=A0ABU7YTP3_9GAMM
MFDGILGYIIGGAVIGVLARFFKPGADPMGWIMTIVLGIAGAVIGGMLVTDGILSWVVAIIVAIVLLFVYEMIRSKQAKRPG